MSDGSPRPDAVAGLIRKLRVRDRLTNEEGKVLAGMVADVSNFPAGTLLVRAGVPLDRCTFRGGDVVIHDPEGGSALPSSSSAIFLERRPGCFLRGRAP